MSLTVTVSHSTSCVDVRWSSEQTSSVLLTTSSLSRGLSQQSVCLVNVAPSDSAAGHKWTVMVRDSTTSALRFDLEQSGIVGTPLVTVKRCHVTRSVLGDECWKVQQVGRSSTAGLGAGSDEFDPLERLFSRMSFSSRSTSPPAAVSDSTPLPVIRLQAPRSSYERVPFARRSDQEFTEFDVNVHREKYHKATVSWNYLSYRQQPDKWQVSLENLTPAKSFVLSLGTCRPELIQFVDAAVRRVEFGVTLKPGNCYRVTVTALRLGAGLSRVDNYCSIGAGQTQFKAGLLQANN